MNVVSQADHQYERFWNGPARHAWIETQDLLDRIFQPFEDLLVEAALAGSRPGQFAFADQRRVCRVLEESGWTAIGIRPIDVTCTPPAKDLVCYLTRLDPLVVFVHQTDERARAEVIETVRASFGAEVRVATACWMVEARARCASSAPREAARG